MKLNERSSFLLNRRNRIFEKISEPNLREALRHFVNNETLLSETRKGLKRYEICLNRFLNQNFLYQPFHDFLKASSN